MAAHQAPPSLGFSRQEHWSGLPFPSPMHESEKWKWSLSVMPDSLWPHGLQPTRLLHPWDIFQATVLEWGAIAFSKSQLYFSLKQRPISRDIFLSLDIETTLPALALWMLWAFLCNFWIPCPSKPTCTLDIKKKIVFVHTTGSVNKNEKWSYLFDDSSLDY